MTTRIHRQTVIWLTGAMALALALVTCPIHASASPKAISPQSQTGTFTIKGVVLDFNNEPIAGAGVYVPGTSVGTTTDLNGDFSLKVPAGTKTVEVYIIGYQKKVIPFSPDKLNAFRVITLVEDTGMTIEDATVVAFAKQKKESVLGSVTTVRPAELKTPTSNLTTGFAGKLAGVVAYQRSGEPGQDNAEFFIRGVTTFGTGKANPLILIDNVELTSSDLARLNPDDIASFSILKDATATALYGARGANGVILVTTKEGAEGKMKLSFRAENSISAPVREVDIADPITFMYLHNEAVRTRNPNNALPYLESEIAARERGLNPYVYPTVDWKRMLFKDYTSNYRGNMNISGGGRVARYYVALFDDYGSGRMTVTESRVEEIRHRVEALGLPTPDAPIEYITDNNKGLFKTRPEVVPGSVSVSSSGTVTLTDWKNVVVFEVRDTDGGLVFASEGKLSPSSKAVFTIPGGWNPSYRILAVSATGERTEVQP